MRHLATLSLLAASSVFAAPKLTTSYRLSPSSEIKVVFDKSIVGKSAVNMTTANNVLDIKPAWKGKIHWKAQNIAIFQPEEASKLGQQYTFSTKKGLKHIDSTKVPVTQLGTKKTFDFEIKRSTRVGRVYNTKRPGIYLCFNEDVDPATVAPFFFFQNADGSRIAAETKQATYGDINSTYYVRSSWSQQYKEAIAKANGEEISSINLKKDTVLKNALIIRPIDTLPAGANWDLHALAGIPSSNKKTKIAEADTFHLGTKLNFKLTQAIAATVPNEPRFLRLKFNTKLDAKHTSGTIAPLITITPEVKNLSYKISGSTVDIHGDFYQYDRYKVKINKQLQALHGLKIQSNKAETVEFEHLDASMAIPSYSTAQLSKGQRKYPIETVNMKSVRVRVKTLNLKQGVRAHHGYNKFLSDQAANDKGERVKRVPVPYSLIDGNTIHDKVYEITNRIDTSETLVLNWDEILPHNRENQIFFLDIEGTPKDKVSGKSNGTHYVQSFIQLTDIGLAWKLNDDEALIYCYSCDTGKPLQHVSLDFYSDDAQKLNNFTSDENGIIRVPRESKVSHLTATLEDDSYIIPFNDKNLKTVALWRFPVKYNWYDFDGWKREVLIFTDRKLYKPGETTRIKGIVREKLDNDSRIPLVKKAQLSIADASGRTLYDEEITLSDKGTFDHTLELPEHNVGTHRIRLEFAIPELAEGEERDWEQEWMMERNSSFTSYFSVQEFRKNAFKVKSKLSQNEENLNKLQAKINANYYMGTVVSKGKVDWYMTNQTVGFYPKEFRNFYFGNHLKYDPYYWDYYYGYDDGNYYSRDQKRTSGSFTLDEEGIGSLDFEIDTPDFPSPQKITLLSEVTDGRDQTITDSSSITVHPSSHYLGLSRIDSLLRVGQQNEIQLIAVNNKGKKANVDFDAEVTIERKTYESVKMMSPSGKVSVQNKEIIELIDKKNITIAADEESTIPFSPAHTGSYNIRVTSKDSDGNLMSTATRYYVYGAREYPWATETGMKINLAPEQKHYKPGDTARVLVMTPIEGTALVTVERSGVLRHFRRELKADNPVIEFPVEHEDAPNMYVSVLVIRGSQESPHKYKEPALKLGYCNINVENTRDRLHVTLDSPEKSYLPGSEVHLSGTIVDSNNQPVKNAEVVLYAEDNGVLDVIGYRMPRPHKHFNKKLALKVECGTSLHKFLQEQAAEDMDMINKSIMNKGYSIGGGGEMDNIQKDVRKNFDPCAVWQPTLSTDSEGRFSVSFTAPDSLTSYRVMAVALAGSQQFGSTDGEIVVNKPFMLEPKAPRFANEGDVTNTKLYVANNSSYAGKWKISLQANSLTQFPGNPNKDKVEQLVELDAGKSAYLNFNVAHVNTGRAQWTWSATPVKLRDTQLDPHLSRELSDSIRSEFDVIYPRPILKDARLHRLNRQGVNILANMDRELLKGRGEIHIEIANNLLFRSNGAADHLLKYPYG